MNKKKCAIFIPARSGSKGLKNKNTKIFANRPLIYWTILQAKKSIAKDHIYVSSDSDKILNICKVLNCNAIKRPKKISGDKSTAEEAILHFINKINVYYEYIILLQPTSPLRYSNDINKSYKKIIKEKKNSLFSGSYYSDLTVWKKNKKFFPFNYDINKRLMRQDHGGFYIENGSIYIFKSDLILNKKNRFDKNSFAFYPMNKLQSLEIDDIDDFRLCEKIFINKIY